MPKNINCINDVIAIYISFLKFVRKYLSFNLSFPYTNFKFIWPRTLSGRVNGNLKFGNNVNSTRIIQQKFSQLYIYIYQMNLKRHQAPKI